MPLRLEALTQVTLHVTHLAQARAFYGGQLGLEELERPESFLFPGAWFRAGTVVIQLVVTAQADPAGARGFSLWTGDMAGARAALTVAGLTITAERAKIPGLNRFSVFDPDGNRVEFQGPDESTWAV